jgi:hypothetical protein
MLRKHLAGLPPEQRTVEEIPRGLAAWIASAWERIATEPPVVDGLGILCAAREPLTLDELGSVACWTGTAARQAFVRSAREWLIETARAGRVPEYRLHHDSIRAHVAEAIGGVRRQTALEALQHERLVAFDPGQLVGRKRARRGLAHLDLRATRQDRQLCGLPVVLSCHLRVIVPTRSDGGDCRVHRVPWRRSHQRRRRIRPLARRPGMARRARGTVGGEPARRPAWVTRAWQAQRAEPTTGA